MASAPMTSPDTAMGMAGGQDTVGVYTGISSLWSESRQIYSIGELNGVKTPSQSREIHHLQAYDSHETDAFHVLFEVTL